MKIAVIIPAAGSGTRTGLNFNKVLYDIGAMPLLSSTLSPFLASPEISKIIIAVNPKDKEKVDKVVSGLNTDKEVITVTGGMTRTETVRNCLPYAEDSDITLIHDAARPFITSDLIEKVINSAKENGAAILAVPVVDTIKKVNNGTVIETVNRSEYVLIQTPQGFKTEELIRAYEAAGNLSYTDDSAVYEKYIGKVSVIEGSPENIKITTEKDFYRFFPRGYRVGVGYDVHPYKEGRKLILGGVEIPHYKGLNGHSDADVLAHAVMDALLTATGNRDIGVLFPDSDEKYLNINSLILLDKVYKIINSQGYKIYNISAEIIAEKPKLMNYIPKMQENLARLLQIDHNNISLAATTTEGLGIVGEEKAVAAYAICGVIKSEVIK